MTDPTEAKHRETEADRWWELHIFAATAAKEFATSAIKSLFLLNGGALIAFNSLFATLLPSKTLRLAQFGDDIFEAAICFVVGLILTVVIAGVAYINYSAIQAGSPGPNQLADYVKTGNIAGWRRPLLRVASWLAWLALLLAITSLGFFFWGSCMSVRILVGLANVI